jgi:DNA mismatch repair protein MutS2
MHDKAFYTLELPKILDQLARYTSFSGGEDLVLTLEPTNKMEDARLWIDETTEARRLLDEKADQFTLGGVHDVRTAALSTVRGIVLDSKTLLDIRFTLRRATTIRRMLSHMKSGFPLLASISEGLEECTGLQHEIARIIGEDGNVQDSASTKLAMIRRDMKITFDRLQSRLNSIITNSNNAPYLQEQLITQRNGRYVIPIKAEFKGRIPGIIHDQSSSGATLWIEPLKTVEVNNEFRELQLAEEKEVRRILRELCDLVAHEADYIVRTVEGLSHLDLVFAKALYANTLRATAPILTGFDTQSTNHRHSGATLKLIQARHPLLNPAKVVPIDMELDEDTYALVITGPNTGGKTVALKTAGLMIMMAQCGMHIPAEPGTTLSVFQNVYADIGDEQSIEQSLSTFSAHMTNIIEILEIVDDKDLVILDELGAGTDPTEGSALARATLSRLLDMGVTTLVTTHHPELKIYSHERAGVRNASVEFDLQTLAPTYRLMIGLPGRSNALAIATRLGLPEDIINDARSMVATEDLVADDLLDEITKTREETRQAYERAAQFQAETEQLREQLLQELDETESARRDVLAETRRKADYEIQELRKEIKQLKKELTGARQPLEVLKTLERATANLGIEIEAPVVDAPFIADEVKKLRLGDTVWVPALLAEGIITELSAEGAEVAVGQLRVRAKMHELEYRKPTKNGEKKQQRRREVVPERGISPGLELDLRGERVEDAVERASEYVDAAYMAHLPFVRIIHGKGTGALRRAVRDILKEHSLVAKFSSGGEKEGGDGVTVVTLVEQF